MNEFLFILWLFVLLVVMSYIAYGKDTPFKRGFVDGFTLRFIWKRFIKK